MNKNIMNKNIVKKNIVKKNIVVKKFGGTSVGTIERIEQVADIIAGDVKKNIAVVAVVSAMSGETNRLISLTEKISSQPSLREFDAVTASGEQVTAGLLALALLKRDIPAQSMLGWQIPIHTSGGHAKARIASVATDAQSPLTEAMASARVPVVAGFQGISNAGSITTLGRGGSDTTAVAIAVAVGAQECQIYTDVDGVYTADPRVVPEARRQGEICFEEMLEMASLGSKVLNIRSVELAGKYGMPIRVLSTFHPDQGTIITSNTTEEHLQTMTNDKDSQLEQVSIAGIAHELDEAQLTVSGLPDAPGVAAKILTEVSAKNIEVDMIVQNVGFRGKADLTFTVHRRDFFAAKKLLLALQEAGQCTEVVGMTEVAKISMVGVGMRSHAGIASKMFQVLADHGINIIAISTSEIKISVLIHEDHLEKAVRSLHDVFCVAPKQA